VGRRRDDDDDVLAARRALAEQDGDETWADQAARQEGDARPGWLRRLSGLPGLGLVVVPLLDRDRARRRHQD
jgi:hypothetical protein